MGLGTGLDKNNGTGNRVGQEWDWEQSWTRMGLGTELDDQEWVWE